MLQQGSNIKIVCKLVFFGYFGFVSEDAMAILGMLMEFAIV